MRALTGPGVWSVVLVWAVVVSLVQATRPRPNILKRTNPTYHQLSDASLTKLTNLTNLDTHLDFNNQSSTLSRLLVPRVAGSAALATLQTLVADHFNSLGWHTQRDSFTASTPYGVKQFTNLIFTHDPSATRKLVLAAHLDSKNFEQDSPEFGFVGATDSAAPCAILMDVADALTGWLDARKKRVELEGGEEGRKGQGETLQIVFFDGEEAFKDWTADDSIYGAKHLAELWSQPTETPSVSSKAPTPLSRISHLVLLDLLGAPNPSVRSFYKTTGWLFDEFAHAERRLGLAGALWPALKGDKYEASLADPNAPSASFFVPRNAPHAAGWFGAIEDDHIPFVRKGVPVVHLIAAPFPSVWHTIKDDASALDLGTVKGWALIVRVAVAEYLGLDPELNARARRSVGEL